MHFLAGARVLFSKLIAEAPTVSEHAGVMPGLPRSMMCGKRLTVPSGNGAGEHRAPGARRGERPIYPAAHGSAQDAGRRPVADRAATAIYGWTRPAGSVLRRRSRSWGKPPAASATPPLNFLFSLGVAQGTSSRTPAPPYSFEESYRASPRGGADAQIEAAGGVRQDDGRPTKAGCRCRNLVPPWEPQWRDP